MKVVTVIVNSKSLAGAIVTPARMSNNSEVKKSVMRRVVAKGRQIRGGTGAE